MSRRGVAADTAGGVPGAEGEGQTRPRTAGMRILVVEDNRDAADSLRLLLGLYGYEVAVAYCGHDGVRAAQQCRPDVVLCDIGLPGLDGYAVASRLRQNPATAKARLIAVTAYGRDEDRRRSHEAGFEQHLVKPVDPDDLRRALDCPGRPEANEWLLRATLAGGPQEMPDCPREEVVRLVTGGTPTGSSAPAAGT